MQHAGLDDALLGPRLARLLAANSPLPAREMVARGLAPLAGAEAWLALYQLWVRGGPTLAEHASRTAGELPPAAVMTALADPHLPAVVLDFMARRRIRSPETLRLIVHHPRVHDATLAALARCAPEQVCGAIAKNQRRWLACPAIAEHLVQNPCCDRATAHAVLELGAREAIAGLGELRRRALAGQGLQDDPATHARATAWMLRSGPADTFPGFAANLSFRPAGSREHSEAARAPSSTDLALRASAALRPVSNLSLRPDLPDQGPSRPGHAPPPARDDLSLQPGPPHPLRDDMSLRPGAPLPALRVGDGGIARASGPPHGITLDDERDALDERDELDELDELDLPIGDDWADDPSDVDVPAPRSAVPLPELELPPAALRPGRPLPHIPQQLELPTPSQGPRAAPDRRRPGYLDSLAQVLDPATPLPRAMSLLHRLRVPDLRRVAAARRLAPPLLAAVRRRMGAG